LYTYFIPDAGLLATFKENLIRVSPLWHVEIILLEEEGLSSENPFPVIVYGGYSESPHSCKQYNSLSMGIIRKTCAHLEC